MSDSRDTNRDGHVSLMEKVKDKLHLGHKDSEFTSTHTTTASSHTTPVAGVMPVAGIMPVAGAYDSCDLNHDGHISTSEKLLSTSMHHDSRDLNRDGHISTSEKLKSATSAHSSGFDTNRDGHISTSEKLSSHHHAAFENDEARLKLHEEQLAISKREVGAGEVSIHKRVEQEHVQQSVPVRHEEVTVERRPLTGTAAPGARIAEQDEIVRVPLYREKIVTEKRLVPTEEVIVRKKEVIDNQVVGATLRSEYVEPTQMGSNAGGLDANRDGRVSLGEKLKGSLGAHDAGHISGEKMKVTAELNPKAARG